MELLSEDGTPCVFHDGIGGCGVVCRVSRTNESEDGDENDVAE